ncbi:MAG: hypothetical protein C0597_09965 [Marinilabiliales bacterium]|nr:MAG: hypothetical protein C0597_09965 [Marinilabiliales bacterium]
MRKLNYFLFVIITLPFSCNNKNIKITTSDNSAELFLPGIVSTSNFEMNASFSETGNEFYYSIADAYQNYNAIVSVTKKKGDWEEPQVVLFSGVYSDFDPFLSDDGNRMYFCSRRPMSVNDTDRDDANIWYVDKVNGKWGEPIALNSKINSEYNEYYVSVSGKNNIYFTSTKPEGVGSWDIYFQNNDDLEVYNIGEPINSSSREWDPLIAKDERFILFTSDREGGYGGGDLYVSFKNESGAWTSPENLGEKVNTEDYEYCPYISWDGEFLYFSRFGGSSLNYSEGIKKSYQDLSNQSQSIENGLGNVYRIRLRELDIFK